MNKHYRCFSPDHGRYFYYSRDNDGEPSESTWDKPNGVNILTDFQYCLHSNALETQSCRDMQGSCVEHKKHARAKIMEEQRRIHKRERCRNESERHSIWLQEVDNVWKLACEQGKESGRVQLISQVSIKKRPLISDRLMKFNDIYKQGISILQLIDLNLTDDSFCNNDDFNNVQISHYLPCTVTELHLTSNLLTRVPSDVLTMTNLIHLNVSRNRLSQLPTNMHLFLKYLEFIDLSNNNIIALPQTLCQLSYLRVINIANNKLSEIVGGCFPPSIVKLNLSSNRLQRVKNEFCRKCSNLQVLNLNDNQLKYLPLDIGFLISLRSLLLCRNRLMEIPSMICSLKNLETILLDYNKNLTALPRNLHLMSKLKELKCEGNPNLTIPPIHVILQGVNKLKRWSAMRFEGNLASQRLTMILSVLDVLQYAVDRDIEDCPVCIREDYFHFTIDNLSLSIKYYKDESIHFPYTIDQVIDGFSHYNDASGPVAHELSPGNWTLKRKLTLERYLTEEIRKQNEINLIRRAMEVSERSALKVLNAEQGRDFVVSLAKVLYYFILSLLDGCDATTFDLFRVDESKVIMLTTQLSLLSAKSEANISQADKSFLTQLIQNDLLLLVCPESSQINQSLIHSYSKKAKELWQYAQDLLRKTFESMLMTKSKKKYSEIGPVISLKLRKLEVETIKQIESYICQHYINFKVDQCRENALITNRKIKKVLSRWMGMSLEIAFLRWKKWSKSKIRQRLNDEKEKQRAIDHDTEDKALQFELARIKELNWTEKSTNFLTDATG